MMFTTFEMAMFALGDNLSCQCDIYNRAAEASGVNFINMLMRSFYDHRSQKRKKTVKSSVAQKDDQLVVLLYFSGFALYAVRSSLIKLTSVSCLKFKPDVLKCVPKT